MTQDEFRQFLQRYNEGDFTDEELRKIKRWFAHIANDELELTEPEKHRIRQRMLRNIRPQRRDKKRVLPLAGWRMWKVAASIAAIILAGYVVVDREVSVSPVGITSADDVDEAFTRIENTMQQVLVHTLPDGSSVELQPRSRILYDKQWSGQTREVRLVGEAFFSVVEDPKKPFFVFSGEVVTKVLGTSFRVKAPEFAECIEVEVKTGQVSVYENPSGEGSGKGRDASGVLLTLNEKVQYYVEAGLWVTSLIDSPQPLSADEEARTAFVFSGMPVKEVFRHIEGAYDIDIIIENEKAYACTFTGDVSSMELYSMLRVICRSINATYEVKGTKILVSGSGCVH